MIIQRVAAGEAPVIIRNIDHAITALALARNFGNDDFAAPHPRALTRAVTLNHEEGWRRIDDHPARNPETGLPYHLEETPLDLRLTQLKASADFNENYHPWCGLLSSIHIWGFGNAEDEHSGDGLFAQNPGEWEGKIAKLRKEEVARQQWLARRLRRKPQTAAWVEPDALRSSYNLLQFFDRLALYFQLAGEGLREDALFADVPTRPGGSEFADMTLSITGSSDARITPYPFARNPLILRCRVRRIWPSESDEDFRQQLKDSAFDDQWYRLSG